MTGCCRTGKIGYPGEVEADDALDRIRRSDRYVTNRSKVPVRSYACEFCGEWHLTSQPSPHRRRAR